ncbi:hypothetical protein PVAND_011440 [Polypedilum vanderplanki]|uniref:C2H2-type domain-containing protein n=1 Tax=Polypedilum vanderplanki TaxID=319348 RepID=A0A9J6CJ81_POLVA|nr:hypothetical protein PVAND_011440 [Polypedilum vanderplanki]
MPGASVQQSQNPTQGLVHWMSAVMAEHMTSGSHHETTAAPVGMHYMWNGTVEQCAQHTKDIADYNNWTSQRNHMSMKQGFEAKMNVTDQYHTNIQKGHILDDIRIDQSGQVAPMYAASSLRTNQNSPGNLHGQSTSTLLVVPQPINATKLPSSGAPNVSGRKYQCKMCPQIFSSKADLQLHTQAHMREAKPYKCTQCSKSFANSSYLSQHTRIHLGIKPYRCEICQRKFTQLSHLQQHIRTHTGDKPYKCRHTGCVKAFSQLSNLQSHSRSHQTDKPFKCNSCYKCFSDEPALLEHIPKHKESKHLKTQICQYCGKSYTQETYLQKHLQKHAERPDKRPPITGGRSQGTQNNNNNNVNNNTVSNNTANNNNNSSANLGNNMGMVPTVSVISQQNQSYWPSKVSPDSAANINSEVVQHQQEFHMSNNNDMHHSRTNENEMNETELDVTPNSGNYDGHEQSKLISNSAFTPINTMSPHFNIQHHQLPQRPYIYDAINIQNKNIVHSSSNSFPNQLISLHQIRNYQPSTLMNNEHLVGINISTKDKD